MLPLLLLLSQSRCALQESATHLLLLVVLSHSCCPAASCSDQQTRWLQLLPEVQAAVAGGLMRCRLLLSRQYWGARVPAS
jgi:hypothetical protein